MICMLLQSCIFDGEEECEGDYYGRLTIENDWINSPQADPEGMAYIFFPAGSGSRWRFDIPGSRGGTVKIPTGRYNCLLFNDDTANIIEIDDDSFSTMSLSMPAGDLYPGCSDRKDYPDSVAAVDQPVLLAPDKVWCDAVHDITVTLSDKDQTIHTTPWPVTATYHIVINNVTNIDGVSRVSGAVSGMASSIEINTRKLSSSAAILPSTLHTTSDNRITGDFLTFGRCSDPSTDNILYLFVWLSSGARYVYQFNVTDIILSAPDPMDVWITIDGLNLPESSGPQEGAFNVGVDGWTNITINM